MAHAAGDMHGIAVGALVVPKRQIQTVRDFLRPREWLKSQSPGDDAKKIHPTEPGVSFQDAEEFFMPLTPQGVAAFGMPEELPAGLRELLADGIISFIPGWRPNTRNAAARERAERLAHLEATGPPPLFRFSELFAGIGGFRLGLEALGGRCVFASELHDRARDCYSENFGGERPWGDVTEIDVSDIPSHDILTAGFPCQSFSLMGTQHGLDATGTGALFWEIVRIARAKRPQALLLENVEALLTNQGGESLRTIEEALHAAGYGCMHQVLNASAFVPQWRARVYLVCFRLDLPPSVISSFHFPDLAGVHCPRPLRSILETDPERTAPFRLSAAQVEKVTSSPFFIARPFAKTASLDIIPGKRRSGMARTLSSNYKSGYAMYSEFIFGEENGGEHLGPRFYTPRECVRLQGFPEDYVITGDPGHFYHMIGNAVSPPVVRSVCRQMLLALGLTPLPCSESSV